MSENELVNPENPYDIENLPYWLKLSSTEFILAILNPLIKSTGNVESWARILLDTPLSREIIFPKAQNRSLSEVSDLILDSTDTIKQILVLAAAYARNLDQPSTS